MPGISVSHWVEFLNRCPAMQRCEVGLRQLLPSTLTNLNLNRAHHGKLQSLHLTSNSTVNFVQFLPSGNFPFLRHLRVYELNVYPPPIISASLMGNLTLKNLQVLALHVNWAKHYAYIAAVLRETTNLEELELVNPTQGNLLPELSFNRPFAILPRLRTFKLWLYGRSCALDPGSVFASTLIEMLDSRCQENIPDGYERLQEFLVGAGVGTVYQKIQDLFAKLPTVLHTQNYIEQNP